MPHALDHSFWTGFTNEHFHRGADQEFKVCAAVASRSSALFTVEYKHLLEMKSGKIEHRIPIESGRNAGNLNVQVSPFFN